MVRGNVQYPISSRKKDDTSIARHSQNEIASSQEALLATLAPGASAGVTIGE
jgi:hypothetical protein